MKRILVYMTLIAAASLFTSCSSGTTITDETTGENLTANVEEITEENVKTETSGDLGEEAVNEILTAGEKEYVLSSETIREISHVVPNIGDSYIDEEQSFGLYKTDSREMTYMVYLGEFKDGKREGTGLWYCPVSGQSFTTEWKEDKPNGKCEFTYSEPRPDGKDLKCTVTVNVEDGLYNGMLSNQKLDDEKVVLVEEVKYDKGIAELTYTLEQPATDQATIDYILSNGGTEDDIPRPEPCYDLFYGVKAYGEEIEDGTALSYEEAVKNEEYLREHLPEECIYELSSPEYELLPIGLPGFAQYLNVADQNEYSEDMTDREQYAEDSAAMKSKFDEGGIPDDSNVKVAVFPFGTVPPTAMEFSDERGAVRKVTFNYDENGKLVTASYVRYKDGKEGTYTFNYEGNRLKSTDFVWNNKGVVVDTELMVYGDNGFVIMSYEDDEELEENFKMHSEIHYEYDNNGKLIKGIQSGYEDDGEDVFDLDGIWTYIYE